MRELILDKLAYPRELVRRYQNLGRCPHNGMYDKNDIACLKCSDQSECEWLFNNNEFSDLHLKPMSYLIGTLAFALDFVSAQTALWEHDCRKCSCEACTWLREGEKLYDELSDNR